MVRVCWCSHRQFHRNCTLQLQEEINRLKAQLAARQAGGAPGTAPGAAGDVQVG